MITREQYLIDVKNTEDEQYAYTQISSGFYTLANLPGNKKLATTYMQKYREYKSLAINCGSFLNTLIAMAPLFEEEE